MISSIAFDINQPAILYVPLQCFEKCKCNRVDKNRGTIQISQAIWSKIPDQCDWSYNKNLIEFRFVYVLWPCTKKQPESQEFLTSPHIGSRLENSGERDADGAR